MPINSLDTVHRIMTREVVSVQEDAPLSTVRQLLRDHPFHHVPVLRGELLVGILSAVDIARLALEGYVRDQATVDAHLDAAFSISQVMTPEPVALQAHDPILRAAEILGDGQFHALPVISPEGHLLGMVTSTDLIRYLATRAR